MGILQVAVFYIVSKLHYHGDPVDEYDSDTGCILGRLCGKWIKKNVGEVKNQ